MFEKHGSTKSNVSSQLEFGPNTRNYKDYGGETIKRQTKAVYGCMVAAQSPWVRAWTAYRLYAHSVCDTKVQLQLQYADWSATYMLYAFAYLVTVHSRAIAK